MVQPPRIATTQGSVGGVFCKQTRYLPLQAQRRSSTKRPSPQYPFSYTLLAVREDHVDEYELVSDTERSCLYVGDDEDLHFSRRSPIGVLTPARGQSYSPRTRLFVSGST